jgi:hypothetical protein
MFAWIKAFLLKEGNTPVGKAVEHAAVAAGSLAVSAVIAAALKGDLTDPHKAFSTLTAIAVLAGTTFLAGVRAYFKAKA